MLIKSIILLVVISTNLNSQQTVGLFKNTPQSYDGYTLFSPLNSGQSYLIDNCGELLHRWQVENSNGLANYLLSDRRLLQTKKINNPIFNGNGSGGGIRLLDWDSQVIWEYDFSDDFMCQHHDIELLPNGNILVNVWSYRSKEESIQAGREKLGTAIWSEKIIELKPDYVNGGGEIVWEWDAWDHLVQDFDETKENFGDVSLSPNLININYFSGDPTNADWLHFNSVDYNAELDQIVLSCHTFSELWIIDHSLTTEETRSNTGGKSGKGGGLIYRWGNPQAYKQGTNDDQILFKQHDPNWIEKGLIDEGKIMVFNNQAGTPENYSDVIIIDPPIDENGNYTYDGGAYLPNEVSWKYEAEKPTDFFATNISGARRLPNGNTLICSGPSGRFFEVDYMGDIVWEYINPATANGVINQGGIATQNAVFRAIRYPRNHSAFQGKNLNQQGYIEYGSEFDCELYTTSVEDRMSKLEIELYPNPVVNEINLKSEDIIKSIEVFNSLGQSQLVEAVGNYEYKLDISNLAAGIYIIEIQNIEGKISREKLIKY